jgi:hypothetical protein
MPHTDVELARGVTLSQYRGLEAARDRKAIAGLIRNRFSQRYLAPVLARGNVKHGFATMAIGCLMVEALESFRQGWPDTRGKSKLAFSLFFASHGEFAAFRSCAAIFWTDVRCGILHQAETRGRWRIRRAGPLLNSRERTVNATAFTRALARALRVYCHTLATADWDDPVWKNCRKKMNAICAASL